MVRSRHNLFYTIDRYDEKCWRQGGKWKRSDEIDESKRFSNVATFYRAKSAFRCFDACPPGSVLTQYFYVHGKRYCKEYEII